MLRALSQLDGCQVRCRENTLAGRLVGLLIDDANWAVRYLGVLLTHDSQDVPRLLPSSVFAPIGEFEGWINACLTPEEFSHGHPLTGPCQELTRDEEGALHRRLHWRPYWSMAGGYPPHRLHDATAAIGARLICRDDPFGTVEDLVVDPANWTVPAFCIEVPAAGAEQRVLLPTSFICWTDWANARFDSEVGTAALQGAPRISMSVPGMAYIERVRRYLLGERAAV